jgi:hypothetical protein
MKGIGLIQHYGSDWRTIVQKFKPKSFVAIGAIAKTKSGKPLHNASWTPEHEALLRQAFADPAYRKANGKVVSKLYKDLGKQMNRTPGAVSYHAWSVGLNKKRIKGTAKVSVKLGVTRAPWSDADFKLLRELYAKGTPVKGVAKALGRTESAIMNKAWELKLDHAWSKTPVLQSPATEEKPVKVIQGQVARIPVVDNVNDMVLLETTLGFVIRNNGKLNFPMDAFIVGIEDLALWNQFCIDILNKGKDISEVFGVPNKFHIERNGNKTVLCYG